MALYNASSTPCDVSLAFCPILCRSSSIFKVGGQPSCRRCGCYSTMNHHKAPGL
jgi:hypothetical protein